ncbi:MAG: hypothetical protein KF688_12830 [Pirellulales bacterium]|nr:hypothetical protein [Pirellulales bacterium]
MISVRRYSRTTSVDRNWRRAAWCAVAATLVLAAGCGSTRTSNTMRTATEQLLISDAVDRAVQQIDFTPLAGQSIYFEERQLAEVVDKSYLVSSMRQHLLASGCVLKDKRDEAEFVVEPRAGAVGTDNHDLLFGIPATNVPQVGVTTTLPAAIPEIPIAKRRNQRGVAKLAVFAYRRDSGEPVWQSGIVANESTANDIWFFGAGPFNRGTIYQGTRLAGRKLEEDAKKNRADNDDARVASMADPALFPGRTSSAAATVAVNDPNVVPASSTATASSATTAPRETDATDESRPASPLSASGPLVLPPPSTANSGLR